MHGIKYMYEYEKSVRRQFKNQNISQDSCPVYIQGRTKVPFVIHNDEKYILCRVIIESNQNHRNNQFIPLGESGPMF